MILSKTTSALTLTLMLVMASGGVSYADSMTAGADGSGPGAAGSSGDYTIPSCSPLQRYDNYTAEVGTALSNSHNYYIGPTTSSTDNSTYIGEAYNNESHGHGIGAGAYYFLVGPTYSPGGTSTNASEAIAWGATQAEYATEDYNEADATVSGHLSSLVIMADVEGTAGTNGWSSNSALNRDVFNQFVTNLESAGTNVGVYSDLSDWTNLENDEAPGTVEWTYQNESSTVMPCPTSSDQFIDAGVGDAYGVFFGGVTKTSNDALAWQFTQAAGDYDQVDLTHYNNLFGSSISP